MQDGHVEIFYLTGTLFINSTIRIDVDSVRHRVEVCQISIWHRRRESWTHFRHVKHVEIFVLPWRLLPCLFQDKRNVWRIVHCVCLTSVFAQHVGSPTLDIADSVPIDDSGRHKKGIVEDRLEHQCEFMYDVPFNQRRFEGE